MVTYWLYYFIVSYVSYLCYWVITIAMINIITVGLRYAMFYVIVSNDNYMMKKDVKLLTV